MKLGSIQFVRALAVILIAYASAFPLTKEFVQPKQADFYYLSSMGCLGLDLLFVVAGFITGYKASQSKERVEGIRFLQRRFFRINILFYITSFLFWASVMFKNWVLKNYVFLDPDAEIQSAIDTLLIIPVTDVPYLYNPFLKLTWALAFLWLSQLLFFVIIFFRVKRQVWLISCMILLLVMAYYVIRPTDLRLTFLFNPILLEFMMGFIIYQSYRRVKKIPVYLLYTVLALGIIWYIVLVFFNKSSMGVSNNILSGVLSLERFLYWGVPSCFIVGSTVLLENAGKLTVIWKNITFRLLGEASYSIFLFHAVAFIFLEILYKKVGFFLSADLSIFFNMLIAIIMGLLFFRWVEKPLLKWFNGQSSIAATETGVQPQTT